MAEPTQSKKKKSIRETVLKPLRTALIVGVTVGLGVILLGELDIVKKSELLLLDMRYRTRPPIKTHPQLGYINYDDASLALYGIWPWPRHRQTALVTVLDIYDAQAAGYDVFFVEENDRVVAKERLVRAMSAGAAGAAAEEAASDGAPPALSAAPSADTVIRAAVRDYDAEFEAAIRHGGNIYLGNIMQLPDVSVASQGAAAVQRWIDESREKWSDLKRNALAAAQPTTVAPSGEMEKYLTKAWDIILPLPALTHAARGIGFEQIAHDLDHTVRLYPMLIMFDGRVYPSIGCTMISDFYNVPIDRWILNPGRDVIIPGATIPETGEQQDVSIPIDLHGQLLMNWSGKYNDHYLHVPFHLVSKYYAYHVAKKIARHYPARVDQYPAIYEEILHAIHEEQMVKDDESARIASEIALAHVLTPAIKSGRGDPFAGLPDTTPADPKRVAAVLRASHDYLAGRPSAGTNDLDLMWQGEIVRNLAWFQSKKRLADVSPYFFPPTEQVLWAGKTQTFSPLDLENKIFMIGLTGVGTIDLNPQPYEAVCPMVGMHTDALNVLLTRQFLKFPDQYASVHLGDKLSRETKSWITSDNSPDIFHYPHPKRIAIAVGLALLTALIGAFLPVGVSFLLGNLLAALYSYYVWWSFATHGRWVLWLEPVAAIEVAVLVGIVAHFIKALRERYQVSAAFSALVSPNVLKLLQSNPDSFSLAGERKPGTMMFSSVQGFARVTRSVAPDELSRVLSLYLTPTSEIITDYDGYIDKYEGHLIMADFGVPLDDSGHAWKCCFAAVEQQIDFGPFVYFVRARYGVGVFVAMGINSGYISAGNMGSDQKMQYTVMGDAVNMAARFMPANLIYDTRVCVGEATLPMLNNHMQMRRLDKLLAKGKTKPTTIYEAMGWSPDAYLKERGSQPIPPSLLTRWSKCPPEKIFGYQKLWIRLEARLNLPLAGRIRTFFDNQLEPAERIIVARDRLDLLSYQQEQAAITAGLAQLLGREAVSAPASGDCDTILAAWIKSTEDVQTSLTEEIRKSPADAPKTGEMRVLLSQATIFYNKLQVLKNRIHDPAIQEEWMTRVIAALRQSVVDAAGAKIADDGSADTLQEEYRTRAEAFFTELSQDPKAYHEMMARAGEITPEQKKLRELYDAAMDLYWDRQWDAALAKMREARDAVPDDGPANAMITRIEAYKHAEPPPAWQGEFVQTKK